MRSGWEGGSLYASLMASGRSPANVIHQHVDAGHFTLIANGEAFSVDSGYGDIQSRFHSVMIPNARDPSRAPEKFDQMFHGGYTETSAVTAYAQYARVNISEQWECCWAYRHMLLIDGPGVSPYAIILDDVNPNCDYRLFRWQLNSEPANTISVVGDSAIICGKVHYLDVHFAYPHTGQYPDDHELSLSAVTESSRSDVGMGDRPQLRGDLNGHNGQLLSLMLPRLDSQAQVRVDTVHGEDQFGFKIQHGEYTDTIVANVISRMIDLDSLNIEATLAVVRRDNSEVCTWGAAADAFSATVDGNTKIGHQTDPSDLAEF
jgi:hypothetical protein